jgi:hypothetical protein
MPDEAVPPATDALLDQLADALLQHLLGRLQSPGPFPTYERMGVSLYDASGNAITAANPLATNVPAGLASSVTVKDGVLSNLATVAAFHNADNQRPGATAFGILTGGVAQLLNAQGGLDRQQETGKDNITNLGVSTGTQQLKSPVATTVTAGGGAGSTAVTLAATKFTNRGAAAWIGVGTSLTFEPGTTNQETAIVTAVNYGTNIVTIWVGSGITNTGLAFTHANSSPVSGGAYNEARDATTPDGSTGAGFAAGATYLFNSTLNAGAGGWESERSFLGELAGATGAGSAIAQEYEDTAGGPILATGLASGFRLTPAQSLQGKGRQTAAITGSVAGNSSVVFASAAATNLVLGGWPILLTGSGVTEVVFTATTWVPGSSATVPLQSPVVNTGQTAAAWDSYAANGPGLNGFLPTGLGIEEEALYDPVTTLYYIERSATQDNAAATNLVMESEALYTHFSGNGMERARSVLGKFLISGTLTAGPGAGVSTLTFTADPSTGVTPLKAGQAILLGPVPASGEIVYVAASYTTGVSVPLTAATALNHAASTTAQWEAFGWNGPGLAGFLASGMDIDEDAVYDPVTGLFFLERSHTQDGIALANVVSEGLILVNGTTGQRLRGNSDGTLPVGGFTASQALTVVTSANTYAAGQAIGGLNTFANAVRLAGGSGVIGAVSLADKDKQNASIDILFFTANPNGVPPVDHTAYAPNATDLLKCIGHVNISTYTALSLNSVGTATGVNLPFSLPSGTALYAVLVSRGAPVYTTVSSLQLTLGIGQD